MQSKIKKVLEVNNDLVVNIGLKGITYKVDGKVIKSLASSRIP